jgi:hypothetical protein
MVRGHIVVIVSVDSRAVSLIKGMVAVVTVVLIGNEDGGRGASEAISIDRGQDRLVNSAVSPVLVPVAPLPLSAVPALVLPVVSADAVVKGSCLVVEAVELVAWGNVDGGTAVDLSLSNVGAILVAHSAV